MPRFVTSSARCRKTAGAHLVSSINAELTKLGFVISEMTVSRYMPRRPAEPDQVKRWVAFLRNHKDDIGQPASRRVLNAETRQRMKGKSMPGCWRGEHLCLSP